MTIQTPSNPERQLDETKFGQAIKDKFQLDKELTHFNNGSYGTVPKVVRKTRLEWLDRIESHPDLFLANEFDEEVAKALAPLAEYIGADVKDVTFISNATQGVNTVLQSLKLNKGDKILNFSTTYAGVKFLLNFLVEKIGVELVEIEHSSGTDEELIQKVSDKVKELESKGEKLTVSVVDAITSVPGLILPYEAITKVLKDHGSLVLIDGAHAFGQIPLNFKEAKFDFFVANLHKWGYAYRPTAILYIAPAHQTEIHPTVISYGYGTKDFKQMFAWPGTIDFSCWLSSPEALKFRKSLGDKEVEQYNHNLAWIGGRKVADILGGQVLGQEYQTAYMVNVSLPNVQGDQAGFLIQKIMWEQYQSRVKLYFYEEKWWIRISAQIFLTLKDFEYLGHALKEVIESENFSALALTFSKDLVIPRFRKNLK